MSLNATTRAAAIGVSCDYPGGNIVVDGIEGDTVRVHQDVRDTEGDWFYFNFRLHGAGGQTINVEFTKSHVLGPLGPAVRYNDVATWSWLGADSMRGYSAFTCHVLPEATSTQFAFAVPYTRSDLDVFIQRHQHAEDLRVEPLCQSRKGRMVPLLCLGKSGADLGVVLTCRHHSCEMVGNYVLEGFVEAVLARDHLGERLRQLDILIVPFADMDGVEEGDQGKNRLPYDHNHDYGDTQIYPETRAIKEMLAAWPGRQRVVIDLHCPWIRGDQNCHVFFSGARRTWAEVLKFGTIFSRHATGALKIDSRFHVAYGEKWNIDSPHPLFKHWASALPGVRMASALEIPYALAGGEVVLPDSARSFGRDLAVGLAQYWTTV